MPNLNEVSEERVSQIVGVAGLLVTLAILPGPNYDPINPIKVLICCGLGFAALGLVYSNKYLRKRLAGRVLWLVVALHGWMFLVLFLSGAPLAQQLFGVFGRNTGIVTYLGLSAFLLAAYSVRNNLDIRRIINYLVVAGTFEVLYGFVQAVGKDPIKWSSQDTFGTLGNINFHSAMVAISASVLLVRISEKNLSQIMRCFLIALEIAHLCMLAINGSFQGQAIFAIIVLFFIPTLIASSQIPKKKFYFISSVLILLLAISLGLAGILKTGPLSKYIYQETILYRADYWHAGFAMTLLKPFFGVGIDSYGDWYRQTRGEISTLRTGPDRISNSAHNLILDFSSGGGFPLALLFLTLVAIAVWNTYRSVKTFDRSNSRSVAQLSISFGWLAFFLQSLVSINQIGVGVWGWIFLGLLLGFQFNSSGEEKIVGQQFKKGKQSSSKGVAIPATSFLLSAAFGLIGILISFLPVKADAAFKNALNSNSADKLEAVLREPASNAWHFIVVIDSLSRSGLNAQAAKHLEEMSKKYPRDFGLWRMAATLPEVNPQIKGKALEELRKLDPFNPNLK